MAGSTAFLTDSNRLRPLWQPPPTACLTAAGAASAVPFLLMHPCPPPLLIRPLGGSPGGAQVLSTGWRSAAVMCRRPGLHGRAPSSAEGGRGCVGPDPPAPPPPFQTSNPPIAQLFCCRRGNCRSFGIFFGGKLAPIHMCVGNCLQMNGVFEYEEKTNRISEICPFCPIGGGGPPLPNRGRGAYMS